MSMGGLAVAIGLVIDDAVVVVENIHRRLESGMERPHVVAATHELVAPIVGSTLTTVVVFAPLALLSGVTGQFFRSLAMTLSIAVLLSLVLSLTLVPILAGRAIAGHTSHEGHRVASADRALTRTASAVCWIGPCWRWWRRHRGRGARPGALSAAGRGFLPEMDEGGFVIDYLTPAGTALAETDARVRRIEARPHEDAGSRGVLTAHRRRAGPLRDGAEQGRHPRAPEAARPAHAIGRRDHRLAARRAAREGARARDRVRAAAAGHARRSRGRAHADRSEDLRRRPGRARRPGGEGRADV